MTAETTAQLERLPEGRHRLSLEGAFTHPHWLAFLCGGLSAAGVSVVEGRATRSGPMLWTGHFVVEGPVEGLDVLQLAAARPAVRDPSPPRLEAFDVTRRPDGQLRVSVEAPDALGFLGRLLSRISLLTLVPSELDIATVGGSIRDVLVLSGIGTSSPRDEVAHALREMLAAMKPAAR